jgi:hypothetical protein
VLVLAAACTGDPTPGPSGTGEPTASVAGTSGGAAGTPSPPDHIDFHLPAPSAGEASSDAVQAGLCTRPAAPKAAPIPTQSVEDQPHSVLESEQRIQEFHELTYLTPVPVERVAEDELRAELEAAFDREYPQELTDRRSRAWSAIGVVPGGTDLREAFHAYLSTQFGAAYDVHTNVLSLVEDRGLGAVAHYGLLHELALALDDQRFELARADPLLAECHDEAWMGAEGVFRGSAAYFATQAAIRLLPPQDQGAIDPDSLYPQPAGVPPFVHAIQTWPDVEGQQFAAIISDVREIEAIAEPLGTFPTSTEQVIHLDKLAEDLPVAVDVPDLGPVLGEGWRDLDVMDVGEEWVRAMLALRLNEHESAAAAEGWDGGRYRAWTDGSQVAVLLETAWDGPDEAQEFLDSMREFIGDDDTAAAGTTQDATRVAGLFATDPGTFEALQDSLR